ASTEVARVDETVARCVELGDEDVGVVAALVRADAAFLERLRRDGEVSGSGRARDVDRSFEIDGDALDPLGAASSDARREDERRGADLLRVEFHDPGVDEAARADRRRLREAIAEDADRGVAGDVELSLSIDAERAPRLPVDAADERR